MGQKTAKSTYFSHPSAEHTRSKNSSSGLRAFPAATSLKFITNLVVVIFEIWHEFMAIKLLFCFLFTLISLNFVGILAFFIMGATNEKKYIDSSTWLFVLISIIIVNNPIFLPALPIK
jgi:hypothetical protein